MTRAMNKKLRISWFAPFAVLILIWSFWASYRYLTPGGHILSLAPGDKTTSQDEGSSINVEGNETASDCPLILYAYYETENARQNLEYFLAHGVHGAADFVFILNGENHAEDIIPTRPNIRYIKRKNDCYDLGAFAEVLTNGDLYMNYKKFITMNASIRGPFLPYWSTGCWSDIFLSRVTEEVKVGSPPKVYNCFSFQYRG
jgi:hypothetical protein